MKYNRVRLINGPAVLDLPLVGEASVFDQFICKGIDGLGPPDNDVSITNGYFQGASPRARQVTARVALNPDWSLGETVSDLREYLYGLLTGGYTRAGVSIIVLNGEIELCRTDGARISKMEPNIFSDDPEMVITLECLGPYLNNKVPTVVNHLGMSKMTPSFANVGTAPTGFHMKALLTGLHGEFRITNEGNLGFLGFNWDDIWGFKTVAGDTIEFDTTEEGAFATLMHIGQPYNLMGAIVPDSEFLQLHAGINNFTLQYEVSSWIKIDYTAQYWGV